MTCKCGNVNPDDAPKCLGCGAEKPAGLSEEERAALACENIGRVARRFGTMGESDFATYPLMRESVVAHYRAARAPLEAELLRAHEREAAAVLERDRARKDAYSDRQRLEAEIAKLRECVRELEERGGRWQCLVDYFWTHPERSIHGELPAQIVQVMRSHDAKMIERARRISELEAQLAQAQKPAAPAGLPEVGSPVWWIGAEKEITVRSHWDGVTDVVTHRPVAGFNCYGAVSFRLSEEGITWRRLPPAQTRREPAASPPVEVTTENLDQVLRRELCDDGLLVVRGPSTPSDRRWLWQVGEAWPGIEADIRANVEREREKGEARIDDYQRRIQADEEHAEFLQNELDLAKKERDAALAEVERLNGELERAKAAKRCPADGMSDADIGRKVRDIYHSFWNWTNPMQTTEILERSGAKARELFTPVATPAQPERKAPKVGDVVWVYTCCDGNDPNRRCSCEPHQRVVGGTTSDEFWWDGKERRRRIDGLGKTWWWSDPSAKGEG